MPSGRVDPGETPESAALRELEEETGFTADNLLLAGVLAPDPGRLANRMWCFYAKARKMDPAPAPEEGVESFSCAAKPLMEMIGNQEFDCALHVATLFMCAGPRIS